MVMETKHIEIKKAIIKSQHCQRNWNLDKTIPEDDLDLLLHAVTQCPSKQNAAFYSVYVITDRTVIEKIHEKTSGFFIVTEGKTVTNSQTLANMLFVFTNNTKKSSRLQDQLHKYGENNHGLNSGLYINIGVASGYLNLTATMLGYSTGCCQCFDQDEISKILNTDDEVILMMGVGFKSDLPRRMHHAKKDIIFPSFKKEQIAVYRL
jgi:nitroreductase